MITGWQWANERESQQPAPTTTIASLCLQDGLWLTTTGGMTTQDTNNTDTKSNRSGMMDNNKVEDEGVTTVAARTVREREGEGE